MIFFFRAIHMFGSTSCFIIVRCVTGGCRPQKRWQVHLWCVRDEFPETDVGPQIILVLAACHPNPQGLDLIQSHGCFVLGLVIGGEACLV